MFVRFIHIAACAGASFLFPSQVLFSSETVCSPFIHSCGWGSSRLLASHSAYVYWLLLCTRRHLRRTLLHAVHSAFAINTAHMRTLRFPVLFLSLSMCVCVYLKIYLFIFGYAGPFLLRGLSLVLQRVASLRRLLSCSAGSRHKAHGFSSCVSGALGQAQRLWCAGLVAPWRVESSQARDRTRAPCVARQFLNHWIIGEAPRYVL